ncbi:hypothetical protein LTR95_005044 [Oleoguttula sp. CCFEE 5521]
MTANSLQIITLAFPDPETISGPPQFERINSSISYTTLLSSNIRTLSTNTANGGADVTGLLYTPTLANGDPCIEASEPYLPANVTRRANLPRYEFDLIAIAPWVSPACTLAYLAAATGDPIEGFLFFLASDDTLNEPPLPNDPVWNLGDGGRWKTDNKFPVYAIPGTYGKQILDESAAYSGNMSSVPNGQQLEGQYTTSDYVRLFVDIDTGNGSTLPSLWVFLLIVLAILLGIIGMTSVFMHWTQRRRRRALQRQVANGEIDLEALGIKRLTVPQEILDRMPLYTYGSGAPVRPEALVAIAPATVNPAKGSSESATSSRPGSPSSPPAVRQPPTLIPASAYQPTAFSQTTCAICLDDYVSPDPATGEVGSIVRELPCQHIFHPECVDTFLRDNSSLCPVCKTTVLPAGFCPTTITNAMVRRERMVRHRRARRAANAAQAAEIDAPADASSPPHTLAERLRARVGRRVSSAPTPAGQPLADLPPAAGNRRSTIGANGAPGLAPQDGSVGRREWARQRAIAMLGRQAAPMDPDAEEAAAMPKWRKMLSGIFPALGTRRP